MNCVLVVLALLNWIAALAIVPIYGLASGALKLQVMSHYHQLRENGVINEERLAKVGWEKLPGTDLQKAHQYFLGDATNFYTTSGLYVSALLAVNGVVLFLGHRRLRKTSETTASAMPPASRQAM